MNTETKRKAYLFMGDISTGVEEINLDDMINILTEDDFDTNAVMFINDKEPAQLNEDKTHCTQKSLDEFQQYVDEEEMVFFGNGSQESMDSTIFCIIETDKEKRLKYMEEIKAYAGDLDFKVIFLTYLDSNFLKHLEEKGIKLSNALYAPYVSDDSNTIGIYGDVEFGLNIASKETNEKLISLYGNDIIEILTGNFPERYQTLQMSIHSSLLNGSYDYLMGCFQQHILKYATLTDLKDDQINELMDQFCLSNLSTNDGIILPDAHQYSKVIQESIFPKHSIFSDAVISESNRIDYLIESTAKVLISNNISAIGIYGVPEGKTIYARFINSLTKTLDDYIKNSKIDTEYKYKLFLIDHINKAVNTPEESINTEFNFEFAIICDNKYFCASKEDKTTVLSYLESAKEKYMTLDINTGIIHCPAKLK